MKRQFSSYAVQRRATRRADNNAHDEKVWEAERKRLTAEATANAKDAAH
jgi:hypothetical protein